jgi:hypothetical protein
MKTPTQSRVRKILAAAAVRFAPGLLAVGIGLLAPVDASAQDPRSLVNLSTAALLSNGGNASSPLLTQGPFWAYLMTGAPTPPQLQWQFLHVANAGNSQRIVSMQSFKDVTAHWYGIYQAVLQMPRMLIDNSTQYRLQLWDITLAFTHPTGGGRYYQLRNSALGLCIADWGSYLNGGWIYQVPCNAGDPRQLWGIWNHALSRWETGSVL